MKSARIVQHLASDAIWWQEDKYALQKQKSKNFLKQKYIGMSKKIEICTLLASSWLK